MLLQWVIGLVTFVMPFCSQPIRAFCLPIHTFFGVVIFGLGIATAMMGITEKLLWTLCVTQVYNSNTNDYDDDDDYYYYHYLLGRLARLPDESDAKQILTASPSENWRRPPGRPRTTWMKTTQQDLESPNLSLNEAIDRDVAQNCPLWRMMSTFGAMHS